MKKVRNYERGLICESLIGKSFENSIEIAGFSGFKVEIEDGNLFSIDVILVKLENNIVVSAK